jgi:hypothetical protein
LLVLADDPFAVEPQSLWKMGVDMTVLGGKVLAFLTTGEMTGG